MANWLTIPHRRAHGMCPVNGIRDLVHWRSGRDWSNEFVYGLGQGGGFAYLRFDSADPPRQVYWGVAGPRQHRYLAELIDAGYSELENRTFKFSWNKARAALEAGTPPVLGPLDMYYLPFYDGLYHRRHIPIHYLLLVGSDGEMAYVHDTDQEGVQALPLGELEPAWEVNVPGLGKRNRLVTFDIPPDIPPDEALIRKSIADQCQTMLHPPVSLVGIPAMHKLAAEIAHWPGELGEERSEKCLRQVREYLSSPPDPEGDHLTAGRDLYIAFLEQAGAMAGLDLAAAIAHLRASMQTIPLLAAAIRERRLEEAADCMAHVAEEERQAFEELFGVIYAVG